MIGEPRTVLERVHKPLELILVAAAGLSKSLELRYLPFSHHHAAVTVLSR